MFNKIIWEEKKVKVKDIPFIPNFFFLSLLKNVTISFFLLWLLCNLNKFLCSFSCYLFEILFSSWFLKWSIMRKIMIVFFSLKQLCNLNKFLPNFVCIPCFRILYIFFYSVMKYYFLRNLNLIGFFISFSFGLIICNFLLWFCNR